VLQLLRLGLGPGQVQRAGIVALLNALASETSAIMLLAGAFVTDPPVIATDKLPAGAPRQPYAATLKASGGDMVFNKPLQNWKLYPGSALPAGLELDAKTGEISGTPTAQGKTTFKITCSDSYGPPQYSEPTELSIQIT
jgi:Putative Ig domain